MQKTFNILIYKDDEINAYWGTCPALKGCNTQGDTVEEVKENMAEAISLYLEDCTAAY
jgi:predicted RNase H-like HicB family nuclease